MMVLSLTGIFTGAGTGTHTISMWYYSAWGVTNNIYLDNGCYSADHIVVREIK